MVPLNTPINEIKEALIVEGYEIHIVSQLKKFKTKAPQPYFLVHVFVNEKFKFIFDMNVFLVFKVSVSAYKAKGAKKCYNYQHFKPLSRSRNKNFIYFSVSTTPD